MYFNSFPILVSKLNVISLSSSHFSFILVSMNLIPFKVFVCIAACVVLTCAEIPVSDIQISVFDSQPTNFENAVMHVMNQTRTFYAKHNVSSLLDIVASYVPYVGELTKTVTELRDTMVEQSTWRNRFTKAITDQTLREIAENEIHRIRSTMQTVETKVKILNENNPDLSNRKTIASILHTELDKLINFFDLKTSLFRKYPLIGAPPLIQLASSIAIFSPIANALIPLEAMHPQLSCKMRDILLDYRPRTVNARLQQLHSDLTLFEVKMDVMSMPYNQNGYLPTDSDLIDCVLGCKALNEMDVTEFCFEDRFGVQNYQDSDRKNCIKDYASMIRHRVEQLFPTDLLDEVCDDSQSKKVLTGKFEWAIETSLFGSAVVGIHFEREL